MKRISAVILILGFVLLIIGGIGPALILITSQSPTLGIIGGAGFSTYLFLMSTAFQGMFSYFVFFGILLLAVGLVCRIILSCRGRN